jgi:hypothetical protein
MSGVPELGGELMERRRVLESEGEEMISTEFELVGTANITEEIAECDITLSKECTELYIICEGLKATGDSQLLARIKNDVLITSNGLNGELTTNAQNTIQHLTRIYKGVWIRTGNNHGQYPLTTSLSSIYRNVTKINVSSISALVLLPSNRERFTAGTIKIYGR